MTIIYLDAGHGGKDGGAAANGIKEKDVVLKICKKIKEKLASYKDVQVILSRETDMFVTLNDRTKKANTSNAAVLVSIHCNAATSNTARGFESFSYPEAGRPTTAFQNVMHQEIIRAMGSNTEDRGQKQKNLHMVRESKMMAILTENLFVSNSKDAALLQNEIFLDKIAQGHVNGLEKFLGLRRIERPPETKPDTVRRKLYHVQVGAFEKKEHAEELVEDLKKEGYKPFIKYE